MLVKLPLIVTSLPVMPALIVGADCTMPSSSIATCLPTYGVATFFTKSSFLKCTLTIHAAVVVSTTAVAVPTLRPVRIVGPRT